jgi:hypothetical protein
MMNPNWSSASSAPADDAERLVPVVARAMEAGRGPQAVVQWIRAHCPPDASCVSRQLVARLARELARALRTDPRCRAVGAGPMAETVVAAPPNPIAPQHPV